MTLKICEKQYIKNSTLLSEHPSFLPLLSLAAPSKIVFIIEKIGTT
jgi:hypothetical protein